jgi:hypothetical protein
MPNPVQLSRVIRPAGALARTAEPWTLAALNPHEWIDFSQLALSDGASIASVPDLMGNTGGYSQGTTASKPTFVANGIGGRGAAQSDGVDDGMTGSTIGAWSEWTAIFVYRPLTITDYGVVWAPDNYNPDASYTLIQQQTGPNRLNVNTAGSLSHSVDTDYAVIVTGSAAALNLYDDKGNTASAAIDRSKGSGVSSLFRRGDGYYSNIRFGEGALLNRIITADERAAVFAALATKWGTSMP